MAESGGGVPTPGGTFGGSDQEGAGPAFPLPNQPGKSAWLLGRVLRPQRPPPGWVSPGGVEGRPGENRRGRREGPSRTRGAAEGICSAHQGPGSLLSSQAILPLSKAHSRLRGPWGHGREVGEIRRGTQEGPSRTGGGEEIGRAHV